MSGIILKARKIETKKKCDRDYDRHAVLRGAITLYTTAMELVHVEVENTGSVQVWFPNTKK